MPGCSARLGVRFPAFHLAAHPLGEDAVEEFLDVSRALYLPSAAVNADAIVKEEAMRCACAVHDMLVTAGDAKFSQPREVSAMLVASIVGPTRMAIEAGGNRESFERLKRHLTALCVGYLREMASTRAG